VKNIIQEKWELKPWVAQILEFLKSKNLPMAIASSSEYSIINCVVEKFRIKEYFQLIYSAEEKYWKPHPWVYLSTCKKIEVSPQDTITFEDSFNGILSAKAAKINCVAVPEEINTKNPKFVIADMKLNSLEEFWEEEWNTLNK